MARGSKDATESAKRRARIRIYPKKFHGRGGIAEKGIAQYFAYAFYVFNVYHDSYQHFVG